VDGIVSDFPEKFWKVRSWKGRERAQGKT